MILLSIVTIAYNNLTGLRTTIDSIDKYLLEYSKLGYVEHIIIDGNSIDGTKSFLREFSFCREVRNKYVSEPDHGIYDAMNKGVGFSSGEFVVFLNSGDEISSKVDIGELFLILEKCTFSVKEAGVALSAFMRFRGRGFIVHSRCVKRQSPCMPTVHQSMFFKRSVLLDFPLDISYKICGDYDNFARIFSSGLTFRVCDDLFSVFYVGGVSSQSPIKLFLESSSVTKKYFHLGFSRRALVKVKLISSLILLQLLLILYGVHNS